MNTTILVRLAGGLGNQLFQFAAAKFLAANGNCLPNTIILDTRFLNSYEVKRELEIEFITESFDNIEFEITKSSFAAIASRLRLAKILDIRLGSFDLISSVDHLKNASFNSSAQSTYLLDGYFQDAEIVFNESQRICIQRNLKQKKSSILNILKQGRRAIAVHIRRGDYVSSNSASQMYNILPFQYYYAGLEKLSKDSNIFVFSDDPVAGASFSSKVNGFNVSQWNLSLEDEFSLLMGCDDYVIANSTFSWWSSYLGADASKIIVAPMHWYKKRSHNKLLTKDMILIDNQV